MNEILTPTRERATTRAADGLPRWRWTAAEIEQMAAAGYFHEHDRFELLGGRDRADVTQGAPSRDHSYRGPPTGSPDWRRTA